MRRTVPPSAEIEEQIDQLLAVGVGENPRADHRDGVGLGNTRARLLSLYGSDHRFEAGSASSGGFAVHIEIPYRTDAAPKESARRESEREALV